MRSTTQSCVSQLGPGPAGTICGLCGHLSARHLPDGRTEYFCTLTGEPRSVTAQSCANYVAAPALRAS